MAIKTDFCESRCRPLGGAMQHKSLLFRESHAFCVSFGNSTFVLEMDAPPPKKNTACLIFLF